MYMIIFPMRIINENDKIDVVVKYLGMDTMDGFDIFARILDK
jgi:PleD family two-component response regulator